MLRILPAHPFVCKTKNRKTGGYIHPRDLRRLTSPFSASNEPELMVRRHVILCNFDPLRAIILRDRLLVIVPEGADSLLVDLERRVRGGIQEYENSVFGDTPEEDDAAAAILAMLDVWGFETVAEEAFLLNNLIDDGIPAHN